MRWSPPWRPWRRAARRNSRNCWDWAEAAALEGAEATKEMVARFGRAKSLMERSLGHQDAGATSVWLIFGAMHEYVRKLC